MPAAIDKARAKELNEMLRETLNAFGRLHGLTLEPYKLRFTASDFKVRLHFIQPNTVGAPSVLPKAEAKASKEAMAYRTRQRELRLPPLGSHIELQGRVFKLTGLRTKKVCMTEVVTGKLYKMNATQAALCKVVQTGDGSAPAPSVMGPNLKQYITQMNTMDRLFSKSAHVPIPTDCLLSAASKARVLQQLESDLSPENLTCDGELRGSRLRARQSFLNAVQKELM